MRHLQAAGQEAGKKTASGQRLKASVATRSLLLLILLTTIILLCMEVVSLYNMNVYRRQTLKNYERSIQDYCDFWDARLSAVNSSIVNLMNADNGGDLSYWTLCNRRSGLGFETSKVMVRDRMTEIAKESGENIMLFTYVPSGGLYVKSMNHLVGPGERAELDRALRSYVEQLTSSNSVKWAYFQHNGISYFINTFALYGGYVGALVPCEDILAGLLEEKEVICETSFLSDDGKVFCALYEGGSDQREKVYSFSIPMEHVSCQIRVAMLENRLLAGQGVAAALLVGTVVIGLALMVWNIRFQISQVLGPLNQLKRAMEEFSRGRLETRLDEKKHTGEEMKILFRTFNNMAEQITDLKIAVYEGRLEQERISANYMRVQIQPHFYTNILNLIYGLAQCRDYRAIQKLSMTTGAYFRYLMGEKGTFVRLGEELACVENYIEIQRLRYEGCFAFTLEAEEGLERELVLPMVLQTFVGNCIKHNISLVPLLSVSVRIWREAGELYLRIADNGTGFEEEILGKIEREEDLGAPGEHIGIRNVRERIRMFYGGKGSVTIESGKAGSVVTVRLPEVLTEEEQDEYHIGG